MAEREPVPTSEESAPTGTFEWGGIQAFETDPETDDYAPQSVFALRISGLYYRAVQLGEANRVDPSVIGDEPAAFDLVGVTGWVDYESEGTTPALAASPYAIYATPDGERWTAIQLAVDVESEDLTEPENPHLSSEARERILADATALEDETDENEDEDEADGGQ